MTALQRMSAAIDEQITAIYGSPLDRGEGEKMARAALLALAAEKELPDLPSRLYQDDALRDWLRIIAEGRLTESTATNAPVPAAHEAPPSP